MDDHYSTLGINKTATADEIKKAYRKLASKHHPDRGGNTATFQKIQSAYDVLSDPVKRASYDSPQPQGFAFNGGVPPGFEDIFSQFGMGNQFENFMFRGGRAGQAGWSSQQKNRNLNIHNTITLEEAFHGKELIANLKLPSGRDQIIEVKIPPGVNDGTTLRISGLGDDTIPNIPRGDIHLTVNIVPNEKFQRQGDDLIILQDLSCIDAILGKRININTIDSKTLSVQIHPGTQNGQLLSIAGYGMPKLSDSRFRGRLLISINIKIPTNLTDEQKELLKQIQT